MESELKALSDYIRSEMGYQGEIDPNVDLLEENIVDSFTIVKIAMFIQDQFGITLEAEDVVRANLSTLSNMVALIEKRKGAASTEV